MASGICRCALDTSKPCERPQRLPETSTSYDPTLQDWSTQCTFQCTCGTSDSNGTSVGHLWKSDKRLDGLVCSMSARNKAFPVILVCVHDFVSPWVHKSTSPQSTLFIRPLFQYSIPPFHSTNTRQPDSAVRGLLGEKQTVYEITGTTSSKFQLSNS